MASDDNTPTEEAAETTEAAPEPVKKTMFEVFMYNVPKVSADGKESLPIAGHKTDVFDAIDGARSCAEKHKSEFERVVLVQVDTEDDRQVKHELIERYRDGAFERAEDIIRR